MKKLFTLAGILLLANCVLSQTNKGGFMIGGSVEYHPVNIHEVEFFQDMTDQQFSFNPKLGFAFSKNWIAGVTGSYIKKQDAYQVSTALSIKRKIKGQTGGLFLRRFQPFSDKFGILAELNANYSVYKYGRTFNETTSENSEQHQYSFYLTPGMYYKPLRFVFVECTFGRVGYIHTTTTPPDGPKTKQDELIPSNLTLGVFFIL